MNRRPRAVGLIDLRLPAPGHFSKRKTSDTLQSVDSREYLPCALAFLAPHPLDFFLDFGAEPIRVNHDLCANTLIRIPIRFRRSAGQNIFHAVMQTLVALAAIQFARSSGRRCAAEWGRDKAGPVDRFGLWSMPFPGIVERACVAGGILAATDIGPDAFARMR